MLKTQTFSRRTFLVSVGAAAAAAPAWALSAYPDRPIKIIMPIQAGGIADTTMRLVADRMTASMGQPFIIDNRPGGNYVIAINGAASAPADGYTFLGFPAGVIATQAVLKKYDLLDSFVPVALTGDLPNVFAVSSASPYKSMRDLVEFGKSNPGKLHYSTPGTAAIEHLKALEFEKAAGFTSVPVPFKGGPDMVMSLIRGDTDFSIMPLGLAAPYATKGQLRFLAMVADERDPLFPSVPSMKDLGINVKPLATWIGLAARKGTPEAVIQRIHSEATKAMQRADVRERLAAFSVRPSSSASPKDFETMIRNDLSLYSAIAADAKLKLD